MGCLWYLSWEPFAQVWCCLLYHLIPKLINQKILMVCPSSLCNVVFKVFQDLANRLSRLFPWLSWNSRRDLLLPNFFGNITVARSRTFASLGKRVRGYEARTQCEGTRQHMKVLEVDTEKILRKGQMTNQHTRLRYCGVWGGLDVSNLSPTWTWWKFYIHIIIILSSNTS